MGGPVLGPKTAIFMSSQGMGTLFGVLPLCAQSLLILTVGLDLEPYALAYWMRQQCFPVITKNSY